MQDMSKFEVTRSENCHACKNSTYLTLISLRQMSESSLTRVAASFSSMAGRAFMISGAAYFKYSVATRQFAKSCGIMTCTWGSRTGLGVGV